MISQQIGNFYTQGTICFHPNELQLLSPINNLIYLIDLDENKNSLLQFHASGNIQQISFCQKGELILIADSLNRVYLYNIDKNIQLGQINLKNNVTKMFFSSNNRLFYIIHQKFVSIYETPKELANILIEPFHLIKKYNSHSYNEISNIKLGPDETLFILADDDNILRIIPIFPNESFKEIYELKGHKTIILDFLDKLKINEKLISIDKNGLMLTWKMVEKTSNNGIQNKTGQKISKINSKNNEIGQITQFEEKLKKSSFILFKKEKIYQENCQIQNVLFHQELLLINFSNKTFCLYNVDLEQENSLQNLLNFKMSDFQPSSVIFHKTKSVIATAFKEKGQLTIWNWRSKHYLLQQQSIEYRISNYDFSQNGQYLALGDYKGNLKLFETSNFVNIISFNEASSKISGTKFINNKTLVSSSLDGVVRVYDLVKRKCFRECLPSQPNQLISLAVEREGEMIFAGGFDPYSIYVWSYQTGKLIDILEFHQAPIPFLLFSDSTQSLISASWDKTIKITKVFSKTQNSETININQRIMDFKLSNNEKKIAIATYDNEIQIYEIENAQMLALLDLNQTYKKGNISSISFTKDDSKILSIGTNNFISFFDINHRIIYEQKEIYLNLEFKNAKEKFNSKNIVDGYDITDLKQTAKDTLNKLVLPGSENYSKNSKQMEIDYSNLSISPDGNNFIFISNQGLVFYCKQKELLNVEIEKHYTKEYLLELLKNKNYVEFILIGLKLKKKELLELLIYKIQKKEMISLLKLMDKNALEKLLIYLNENFRKEQIEKFIQWIFLILNLRKEDLKQEQILHQLKIIQLKLKELLETFTETNEEIHALLVFLKDQLKSNENKEN